MRQTRTFVLVCEIHLDIGKPLKLKKNLGTIAVPRFSQLAAGEGFESPVGDFKPYRLMSSNAAKYCGARVSEKYQFMFC
nr:MAG TPA: Ribonuclease H-like protein [Caudoviricetes sp.]